MDNACFVWSVVATLYPAESHIENRRIRITILYLANIEFPITFKDIPKFENLNIHNK